MNKRGQGLPLNMIVIAIVVVVALVVLVAFFLGAFGKLGGKAGTTTGTALEGTELSLAVASCENLCNQAKALPDSLKKASAYCTKDFGILKEDEVVKQKCKEIGVECNDETGKDVCET